MSRHEYTTPLFVHDDGTLAVHGGDIRGLVIEADTLDELRSELHQTAHRQRDTQERGDRRQGLICTVIASSAQHLV